MFVINPKNFLQLLTKINLRNIYTFFNSITLFIRTTKYIKYGTFKIIEKKPNGKILLLMHFGIGDFFNMLPAIKYLAKINREVHVFVNKRNLLELKNFCPEKNIYLKAIEDVVEIEDYYNICVPLIKRTYSNYDLITLGKFNHKFAFDYPISFYLELGVDPRIAFTENLDLDKKSLRGVVLEFFEKIQNPYIFTHLTASNKEVDWSVNISCDTLILDPFVNRNNYPSKNFDIAQAYLELKLQLIEHLFFLTKSSECYLIDSSFFNFLAHVNYKGKAYAYMRGQYFHKLDERLLRNYEIIRI